MWARVQAALPRRSRPACAPGSCPRWVLGGPRLRRWPWWRSWPDAGRARRGRCRRRPPRPRRSRRPAPATRRADPAGGRRRSLRSHADGAGRAGQRRPVAGRDSRRRAGPGRRPGVDQPGDPAVGGRDAGDEVMAGLLEDLERVLLGSGQRRRRRHRRRAGNGAGADRVAGDSVPPAGDHLRRAAARGAAAARDAGGAGVVSGRRGR